MLAFPRTVYRSPGKTKASKGVSFDGLLVKDQDAYDEALKAGWFDSVDEAMAVAKAPKATIFTKEDARLWDAQYAPAVILPADDRPTRAELEAEAKRLGLSVHGNMSDKRLAERILDAHRAQDLAPTE